MVYFIAFVREAEALEGVRARDRHRVRAGAAVLPGNGAWQGGGGGEREKSSEWKEEEPCTMEGVRDEVGEGRRRGEGHGRREGREVGIRMAQMRDKSRAELYGVFMAVVRVLFGTQSFTVCSWPWYRSFVCLGCQRRSGQEERHCIHRTGYALAPATGRRRLGLPLEGRGMTGGGGT